MRTLTVTLEDLEGIPHGTIAAGTTLSVTARYSREVILTDGTIIPPAIKVADLPGTGVASFEVHESDSTLVDPDYRDFAIVVEATVTDGPRRRGVTFRRTVKVLTSTSPVGEPVPLGTLPSTEGLPAKWTSISDLMGELTTTVAAEVNDPTSAAHQAVQAASAGAAVSAVEGELADPTSPSRQAIETVASGYNADTLAAAEAAQTSAEAAASDADAAVTLAQQAQAAAYEVPDMAMRDIINNPATATAAALDGRYTNRARTPLMLLDYAVGDGVTNDTAGVQAAFDAAVAQARPLFSPPGKTYLVDPLTAAGGLTLDGTFEFKARTTDQAHIITPTGRLDWSRASVYLNADYKALYGLRGSGYGRSLFGTLDVRRCKVWGVQSDPAGNNNHCQVARFVAVSNGASVAQTLTETAETANVSTSTSGYGTFTLSAPLTAAQAATDAVYFVIVAGLAYKVRTLTTTTVEVFNLKAASGVGGTVAATVVAGGAINWPSYGDSGVWTFGAVDVISNPGMGIHHAALYGHTLNNAVIQGNGIGFGCNSSTQQMTFTKPYFELNTVDYATWAYVDGVMLAPLLDPSRVQNLIGRIGGNGGFDPSMVIIKTAMRGMSTDVTPALNPGSRTVTPGMTYQFHRSSGAWAFTINNAPGHEAFGAYSILLELSHTLPSTKAAITLTLGTANGDTIDGGSSWTDAVGGRTLLAITKVGTDWKVLPLRDGVAAGAITGAPVYLGQTAVVAGVGYIATGTSAASDWKQIT